MSSQRLFVGTVLTFIAICVNLWLFDKFNIGIPQRVELFKKDSYADMKKIVLWTSWFGDRNWRHVLNGKKERIVDCGVRSCLYSVNRTDPLLYDALVYHGRDAQSPPKTRLPRQVYVMLLVESPRHRGGFVHGDHFYNWSATYSRKSDILAGYFSVYKKTSTGQGSKSLPVLPQMSYKRSKGEAMVAWVVSNCHAPSKRQRYVSLLQPHINVDIYGRCGKMCLGKTRLRGMSCIEALVKTGRYKFYLSFENSACQDYITEKVYKPLKVGLVPVVYGGLSAEDYKLKLPPQSYIDARNFTSALKLVEHLNYLDKNDTAYLAYHAWRQHYRVEGVNYLCNLCRALYNRTMILPRNINWDKFWNPRTECDSNLLKKLKGPK